MPGTLSDDPVSIPSARRAELRRIVSDHGLEFVGLHNLLSVPAGLHATASDPTLRTRAWDFVRSLADLCADLGPNGILVFGSAKQRAAPEGVPMADAIARFRDGLASVAPHARDLHVTILIEPLAPNLCNLVNRLEEAVSLVRAIDSSAVRTMFDVHNTLDETEPHAVLVDRYFEDIRHVHVNELDGRHCGTGAYDFKPVLEVLRRRSYAGWISLEVFDFTPGAETIAGESLRHLERLIAELPS